MLITRGRAIFATTVAVLGFSLPTHNRPIAKKPLPFVVSAPNTTAATASCSNAPTIMADRPIPPEISFANCYMLLGSSGFYAHKNELFKSELWHDFESALAGLSNQELVGFAGLDLNYADWFLCNDTFYQQLHDYPRAPQPFNNLRHMLTFRFFVNVVSEKAIEEIKDWSGIKLEDILEQDKLTTGIAAFKRLYQSAKNTEGVFPIYLYPFFVYVKNNNGLTLTSNDINKETGKWVIFTDSREKGLEMVESLMPCFAGNKLFSLKVSLNPQLGTYHVVIYTDKDHDPNVEAIASVFSSDIKPSWIYDWQCYEGFVLAAALKEFIDYDFPEKLTGQEQQEIKESIKNDTLMQSLGLTSFQQQVFLQGLDLDQHTNLADPITLVAHYSLGKPNLVWALTAVALKPENQARFKQSLLKHHATWSFCLDAE